MEMILTSLTLKPFTSCWTHLRFFCDCFEPEVYWGPRTSRRCKPDSHWSRKNHGWKQGFKKGCCCMNFRPKEDSKDSKLPENGRFLRNCNQKGKFKMIAPLKTVSICRILSINTGCCKRGGGGVAKKDQKNILLTFESSTEDRSSWKIDLGVSLNGGTPKSSILIGFSIINHPFWGTPIFGNTHFLKLQMLPLIKRLIFFFSFSSRLYTENVSFFMRF